MGIEQLPKLKINGIEYFLDVRLNEVRRVDIPFISESLERIELSGDKVDVVSLRKDMATDVTCLNTKEINALNRLNLTKKSIKKIKDAGRCWKG